MANTTLRGAQQVHGTNPQFLVERIIRGRIYDSNYWKEHCFALNAETTIDKCVDLRYVGGTYANQRPTEFMCLTLKLLQLQPEKEIILEYLRAEEFKYLRALAAFYIRLTFDPVNVYEALEPLLNDYRKLVYRALDGSYTVTTIDAFVDDLLTEERVCDIQLPRLTQRRVLEETEGLPLRQSKLGKALGIKFREGEGEDAGSRSASPGGARSDDEDERFVSRSPSLASDRSAASAQSDAEGRYVSRSPSPAGSDRYISQSPSPSPEPDDKDAS